MALNIDDEIRWLTTEILPLILKNGRLIENYSASQLDTFKVGDIKIAVIGTDEAFMLTQCYRAQVNFTYAGAQYQHKLVVKVSTRTFQVVYSVKLVSQFSRKHLNCQKSITLALNSMISSTMRYASTLRFFR